MKIDYQLKADILKNHKDKINEEISLSKNIYNLCKKRNELEDLIDYRDNKEYKDLSDRIQNLYRAYDLICKNDLLFNEARKINKSRYKRSSRIKEIIKEWLVISQWYDSKILFITLTFNNETLQDTSEKTRRRYITRALKQVSRYYLANQDFGADNEREHYHALLLLKKGEKVNRNYMKQYWCYGFSNTKEVRLDLTDLTKVSKYVSKLTNHAIKETNKRSVMIYSKELNKLNLEY